ncbi:MAG TPA: flagellar M-ring protein FliF C-terminal domain-containing protein [Acidocella sp.]|nr:flagellar M-ring protein FliF C-terminal domain-containing protein [Acidocella sp.]
MADWRAQLTKVKTQALQAPRLLLAGGAVVALSAALVGWLEFSSPPYAVLEEGLSPADGGKVIAALQKLGIPYQLQASGDVILVPAPQLAQARLQLGAAQVPGNDVNSAWAQVENAPITASDQAQQAMGNQALELSLQQSIESLQGISSAQVFLAIPAQTPFLADQPKASASVVINADAAAAQAQGAAIAGLVAGAVPGLAPEQVTVETTSGVTVFPQTGVAGNAAQLGTTADIEAQAAARVAEILTPLVGARNFRTGISADIDFTEIQTHQTSYGPGHFVQHAVQDQSHQIGSTQMPAIGIPGALSNQPPAATTANPANVPTQGGAQAGAPAAGNQAAAAQTPRQDSDNEDQTYENDVSDSDITRPDWAVKGIAVSVVINKDALGALSTEQVKTAIAGAFSYPDVTVNVLAAPFRSQGAIGTNLLDASSGAIAHALLELLAAAFVLLGVALPLSRRLQSIDLKAILIPPPPPAPAPIPVPVVRPELMTPAMNFAPLREQVAENPRNVANLLQSWAEEPETRAER